MCKVFISHSTRDQAFVEREIVAILQHHRIKTWYSREDITLGEEWERTILQALKECDWFLVVLSPRALASESVKDEVYWAVRNRLGRIVPVMMEPCEVEQFHMRLPRIQHVDFSGNTLEARRNLLAVWGRDNSDPGWELLDWQPCECGSVGFRFNYKVEEEGTYQAKCTTYYRCERCGKEWSVWERDWN